MPAVEVAEVESKVRLGVDLELAEEAVSEEVDEDAVDDAVEAKPLGLRAINCVE